MRISIVMSNCPRKPTGGHRVVFEYMNYLAKNNDVSVYFGYDEGFGSFHIPGFMKKLLAKYATKFFRPKWFSFDRKIRKKCVREFRNSTIRDADIVIATDVKTAFPVFRLNAEKGKKIYLIQGFENWLVSDRFVKETYKLDMQKIVVSKWLRELVESVSDEKNVCYVSNSINTDIFRSENTNREKHSIVFQYRSSPAKGCSDAIEVIKKLKDRYSDLIVNIISNEKKPACIPDWCAYFYNVPLREVARINRRSEIFICTSIEEGFGLPGLEAMACGCAVVSTAYRGVYEYAVDGENALLSPVRDVDAMVGNVINLLEDTTLRNRIVRNGIQTGAKRSLESSAKEFERAILHEVKRKGK